MSNLPAVISPDHRAELADLYVVLQIAAKRAADELRRTDGEPLEGLALERFLAMDAKILSIVSHINEILEVLSTTR
jgi:hypothetical protein